MSVGNHLYFHVKQWLMQTKQGVGQICASTKRRLVKCFTLEPAETKETLTSTHAGRSQVSPRATSVARQKEVLEYALQTLMTLREQQEHTLKHKESYLEALDTLLSAWFHPKMGTALLIQSEELLGFIDALLEFWPQDTMLLERKCLAYWLAGMPQAAQNLAYTLTEQSPELPFCNYVLAEMAFREGKLSIVQSKLFFLRKVLDGKRKHGVLLPQAYTWIRYRVVQLQREYARLKVGQRLKGMSPFLQLPQDPQTPQLYHMAQWMMAECQAVLSSVKKLLHELSFVSLGYYQLWFQMVQMYQTIPKRIELLQTWQKEYPNVTWLKTYLGTQYAKLGKTDAAILQWQSAVLLDPHDQKAWQALGEYYERLLLPQKCLMIYEKLATLYPKDPEVYCQIGNFCVDLKQYSKAYEMYQVAFRLGYDPEWQALVAVSLAQLACLLPGRVEAAKAWYHIAIQLNPRAKEPYTQLGSLAFDTNEYKLSQTVCETAKQVMPKDASMCANLGYLYWHEGRIPEAVRAYEEALAMNPLYEVAWNNLGVIMLDGVAHMPRAIHCLDMAIQLKTDYLLARFNLARAYHHVNEDTKAAEQLIIVKQLNHIFKELQEDELQSLWQQVFRHPDASSSTASYTSETSPASGQDTPQNLFGTMLLLPERSSAKEPPSASKVTGMPKPHTHASWQYPPTVPPTLIENSQEPSVAQSQVPHHGNEPPSSHASVTQDPPQANPLTDPISTECVIYIDSQGLAWHTLSQAQGLQGELPQQASTPIFIADETTHKQLESIFTQYHQTQDEEALLYALGEWFQDLEGKVPNLFLPNAPETFRQLHDSVPPTVEALPPDELEPPSDQNAPRNA
ncbi:MAG: tetratricopeptide repeat protein [Vampirovibrionales bacterium]